MVNNEKDEDCPFGDFTGKIYDLAEPYRGFLNLSKAFEVSNGKSKMSVFKYMPLSNCFFGHDLVPKDVRFAIRFSSPERLNDHFDSLPYLPGKSTNHENSKSEEDKIEGPDVESVKKRLNDRYRWCCLSIDSGNPILWALYADSCKGICVEYDLLEINKAAGGNLGFRPINYQKTRYSPRSPLKNDDGIIFESLWKKSMLWCFEQEIRAVVMDEGDKAASIDGKNAHIESNRLKRGRDFEWRGKYDNYPYNKQPFVYKDTSSFYLSVKPTKIYLGPVLSSLENPKSDEEKDLLAKREKLLAINGEIDVVRTNYSDRYFQIVAQRGNR